MEPTHRRSAFAGIAIILGCVACCALPILATLGIGGLVTGITVWLASHSIAVAGVATVLVSALAIGIGHVRKRRAAEADCAEECRTDRSCCGTGKC